MADPRVVSGFKPATKELSYPLVCNKSTGSSIWDIDGNQYIDLVNGFGSNILGYQPDFIKEALHNQIEKGFEIGPQHELAGEVSELIKELTQHERVGLCNTGSEAVLGAMRIVRTVSGKPLIVTFSDSYHGIHDEVLVRGTQKKKTFPAAPGVLPEAVKNILVLEYGNPESLTFIKNRAHEIAGVLVEPVQSRNPKLQPADFLKSLRALTTDLEIALIFDEIITGFRIHPQGAQGYFGVKADLATYGKVVGGGLSVGVIAGKKKFLDALDGGYWQFGDDSIPEVGVTYFAGTFVRHPLALAAAKASLTFIKSKGMDLSTELNKASEYLVTSLNALFAEQGVPIVVDHFGSLMKLIFKQEVLHQELLYVLLRERGIHLQDGFPMYLTLAHSKEDLDKVIQAFKESIALLVEFEFLPSVHPKEVETPAKSIIRQDAPPVPNARLGRDADGNPAWFIKDPVRAGKYLQIEI